MTTVTDDGILGQVHVSKVGFPATFWDCVITQDVLFFVRTSKASFFWAMFGLIGMLMIRSKAKKTFLATAAMSLDDKIASSKETISIARQDISSLVLKKRNFKLKTTTGQKHTFNYFDKEGCVDGQSPDALLAAFVPPGA